MVLLHLFLQSPWKIGVAHCNFHLRGEDSNADAAFVQKMVEQHPHISFYCADFDTQAYAQENNLSIEMAARKQRYDFFFALMQRYHYTHIATAHHLNDSVETLFLNMLRSTGISGLHGILPQANHIIRPLLFATRRQIEAYAEANGIAFREDVTNRSDAYLRNKIRHRIIPTMEEMRPDFLAGMEKNINRFREQELIYREAIEQKRQALLTVGPNADVLNWAALQQETAAKTLLFELLRPYGINESQAEQLMADGETGGIVYTPSHRILRDRNRLVIQPLSAQVGQDRYVFSEITDINQCPLPISAKLVNGNDISAFPKQANTAFLDVYHMQPPFVLRHVEPGDRFYPFGMKGQKKLSDFLINQKLNRFQKENIWVLVDGLNRILWVVGLRSDNRFRVTEKTQRFVFLELTNKDFI